MTVEQVRTRRSYESPLRRQQAAETRDRIVAAGCDLLRRSSVRDWRGLTVRAVAEQAGVNERTVYRYFTNERGLRDAVMRRLEERAGIDLAGMGLGDIPDVTARILTEMAAHPHEPKAPLDPTLQDANRRQREALGQALAPFTSDWPPPQRTAVAALFDVLWSVAAYERLVVDWQIPSGDAASALIWLTGLVSDAVRQGKRPAP